MKWLITVVLTGDIRLEYELTAATAQSAMYAAITSSDLRQRDLNDGIQRVTFARVAG